MPSEYIGSIFYIEPMAPALAGPNSQVVSPVNEILKFIGIQNPPRWVVDKDWAMVAVSIVSVWR